MLGCRSDGWREKSNDTRFGVCQAAPGGPDPRDLIYFYKTFEIRNRLNRLCKSSFYRHFHDWSVARYNDCTQRDQVKQNGSNRHPPQNRESNCWISKFKYLMRDSTRQSHLSVHHTDSLVSQPHGDQRTRKNGMREKIKKSNKGR